MPIYRQVPSRPKGRISSNGHYLRMSVSVVASSRFEPPNLIPTESGEERLLALHKNHEWRAGSSDSRNAWLWNDRSTRRADIGHNADVS
jgi:hypothetical protein